MKFSLRPKNWIIGIVCLIIQNTSYSQTKNDALFQESWKTKYRSEKVIGFSKVVKEPGNSPQIVTARGWLKSYNHFEKEGIDLLKECITRHPDFLPTYFLLYEILPDSAQEEKIEILKYLITKDPKFHSYTPLIELQKVLLFKHQSLERWNSTFSKLDDIDQYIVSYVNGVVAEFNGDVSKAKSFYEIAVKENDSCLPCVNSLSRVNKNFMRLEEALEPLISYARSNHNESYPLVLIANQLPSSVNKANLYRKAFRRSPSADLVDLFFQQAQRTPHPDSVLSCVLNNDLSIDIDALSLDEEKCGISPVSAVSFLEEANSIYPNNHLILRTLGKLYSEYESSPRLSKIYFEKAIAFSPTLFDTLVNSIALSNYHERITFEYDKAKDILTRFLDVWNDDEFIHDNLFLNRFYAQDFVTAKFHLDRSKRVFMESGGEGNGAWYRDREKALSRYSKMIESYSSFIANNQFLDSWISLFGEDLTCLAQFELDGYELNDESKRELDLIGLLLQEKASEKYFFSIEGHASSVENNIDVLAEKRALAVKSYLIREHKILPSRLHIDNFSSRIPVSGAEVNSSNRRVEIIPLGTSEKPEIAVTSILSASRNLDVSPDGKVFVTGNYPLQLWRSDGIKLKDLYKGQESKFSGNGRFLASISDDVESGGSQITNSIKIFDVKTNFLVAIVPSPDHIRSFDWNPNSEEIGYVTDNGDLVIYSLKHLKNVRTTRIGYRRISGPIHWLSSGDLILVGQAQHKILTLIDAGTLRKYKELSGVDWPHQLGETYDSKYILCVDNKSTLSVWNTRTWVRSSMDSIPYPVQIPGEIVSHPSRSEIYVTDFGGGLSQQLTHVDVENLKVLNRKNVGRNMVGIDITPDGSELLLSRPDNNSIVVLDANTLQEKSILTGESNKPLGTIANESFNVLATFDDSGVQFWDVKSGTNLKSLEQQNVGTIKILNKEKQVYIATVEDSKAGITRVLTIDAANNFEISEVLSLNYKVDVLKVRKKYIGFAGKNFFPPDTISTDGIVEIFDMQYNLISQISIPFATQELRFDRLYDGGFTGFDFEEGSLEIIASTYWQDGFGHSNSYSPVARIYDGETGTKVDGIYYEGESIYQVLFKSKDSVDVTIGSHTLTVDRIKRRIIDYSDIGVNETVIQLDEKSFIKWSHREIELHSQNSVEEISSSDSYYLNVEVFKDLDLLVSLSSSNELSFYSLSQRKKVLTIVAKKNEQWIAYTPKGQFSASPLGTKKVYWSLGNRLVDFLSYRDKFENPDFFSETLDFEGPPLESFDPTHKLLVDNSDNLIQTSNKVFKLSFSIIGKDPESLDVQFVHLDSRGSTLSQTSGFKKLRHINLGSSESRNSYEKIFKLNGGVNVIEISIKPQNGVSQRKKILVNLLPKVRKHEGILSFSSPLPRGFQIDSTIIINKQQVSITSILNNNGVNEVRILGKDSTWFDKYLNDGINWIQTKRDQYKFYLGNGKLEKFKNPYANSHAIIVAIDDYDRDSNAKLGPTGYEPTDFLVSQARKLKKTLIPLGFPEGNIVTLFNKEATSGKILEVIKSYWSGNENSNADRVVIYFAGHGDVYKNPINELDQVPYLVTYDYNPQSPTQKSLLMHDLIHNGSRMNAKHVLFAIESCHSGLATKTLDQKTLSQKELHYTLNQVRSDVRNRARNVILAGTGDQKALYVNGGVFTKALIDGLSGKGDTNGDGIIQFLELYLFVEKQVIGDVALINSEFEQKPHFEELEVGSVYKGRVIFTRPILSSY